MPTKERSVRRHYTELLGAVGCSTVTKQELTGSELADDCAYEAILRPSSRGLNSPIIDHTISVLIFSIPVTRKGALTPLYATVATGVPIRGWELNRVLKFLINLRMVILR